MKLFTKAALTFITASVVTTSAFASTDDTGFDRLLSAKSSVKALTATLENLGENVDNSVNLSGAHTISQKVAIYHAKHDALQDQFNAR